MLKQHPMNFIKTAFSFSLYLELCERNRRMNEVVKNNEEFLKTRSPFSCGAGGIENLITEQKIHVIPNWFYTLFISIYVSQCVCVPLHLANVSTETTQNSMELEG